jgi:hypothetical protein
MPIFNAMKETNPEKWFITTVLISLILPAIVAGINYFMDPLWCFNFSNKYNQCQIEINERKQKTNYITFRDFNYRGVLIGSSRSALINQYSFRGLPVYNYSLNDIKIDELSPYVAYAKKRKGGDFDVIFLGLDFENCSRYGIDAAITAGIEQNFEETGGLFYRVKTLLSIDTLKYSYQNLNNYRHGYWRYYDRNNVEHIKEYTKDELVRIYARHLKNYTDKKTSRYLNFSYNEEYKKYLIKFREENSRSLITVYLTPVALPIMDLMARYDLVDDYFRWLSEVLDVFGECYLFMYPNKVTNDYFKYFFDPNHMSPATGDMIADAIYNNKILGDSDFGMHITRDNFAAKRPVLERLMKNARDPRVERILGKKI